MLGTAKSAWILELPMTDGSPTEVLPAQRNPWECCCRSVRSTGDLKDSPQPASTGPTARLPPGLAHLQCVPRSLTFFKK